MSHTRDDRTTDAMFDYGSKMIHKVPARIVGCLVPGTIDVLIVLNGRDLSPIRIPVDAVPPEFRLPNHEFTAIMEGCEVIGGESIAAQP
jgi:hypothetical protein